MPKKRTYRDPYSALTKAIVSQPSRDYVAARPFNVYSTGGGRDMFEGRHVTLQAASAAADTIARTRAPGAYVKSELGVLYKAGKVPD